MFKPTQPLLKRLRRLALTTKQVNGGYYKGTGSGSMGRHTKHGGYIIEWNKVRTYVVPEALQDCQLTPFVSKNIKSARGRFENDPQGGLSAMRYLTRWKEENGQD
ncbi:50S ribosomal protein-like protein YmL27 [Xylona heveae TC161]|uniref:50S ribosomal protein-like protein YmL27 n=1 Tax=Xylona heveae (strain CBS 132557 / TC161) TaxID=1328760 RepID=A0A161TFQ0_XYLHT|nr:50S ribosomal protein-like protein YmL27 [Xylona heveae TC161]KZF24887.1 50S ribosomal protein-like protein YmL27 [Xylona heveae TC161]